MLTDNVGQPLAFIQHDNFIFVMGLLVGESCHCMIILYCLLCAQEFVHIVDCIVCAHLLCSILCGLFAWFLK